MGDTYLVKAFYVYKTLPKNTIKGMKCNLDTFKLHDLEYDIDDGKLILVNHVCENCN